MESISTAIHSSNIKLTVWPQWDSSCGLFYTPPPTKETRQFSKKSVSCLSQCWVHEEVILQNQWICIQIEGAFKYPWTYLGIYLKTSMWTTPYLSHTWTQEQTILNRKLICLWMCMTEMCIHATVDGHITITENLRGYPKDGTSWKTLRSFLEPHDYLEDAGCMQNPAVMKSYW